MNKYLVIITTALVITQIIRVVQNTMQLHRQTRMMKAHLERVELDIKEEVFTPNLDTLKGWDNNVEPESIRSQGCWIGEADGYADGELVYDVWYCSECNYCIDDGTDSPDLLPNYCPNCGAYMKGAGEDADS